MTNSKKSYTREFKAKVVLEAVSGEEVNPQEVADRHELSAAQILSWAREMDISDVNLEKLSAGAEDPESESVDLNTSSTLFASEVNFGATFDVIDMKKLIYWSIFGSAYVGLLVLAVMAIFTFSTASTVQQVSEQSEFYDVQNLKQRDQESLSSFGIVNLEEGIYHVPVDSVISRMTQDEE
ncbi:MAG: hypothetical protein WEC12_07040 [Balneolaceae bacterium]